VFVSNPFGSIITSHSNDKTDFSGSTFIFGNAESVNGFNGLASATISGTINGSAAVITLPSIADVLAAVGSYTTLTANQSITPANASSFDGKTWYVIGDVNISGGATVNATFISSHNVTLDTSSQVIANSSGNGLAIFAASNEDVGGDQGLAPDIRGSVWAHNVDVHTGGTISASVPDGGSTLALLAPVLIGLARWGRKFRT
jgi:hypothetical protein